MTKTLRRLLDLATSRRVRVVAVLVALMAARWALLGRPGGDELASFVGLLGVWLWGEAERRHADANLLTSRRLLVTLVGQVAVVLLGRAGLDLGPEVVASVAGLLACVVVAEAKRPHGAPAAASADPEDAPPEAGVGG